VKVVTYLIAVIVGLLGVMFLAGNQGVVLRIVVGAVLIIAAIAIVFLSRVQPRTSQTTTVQKIDLSGDVDIQEIRCRSCNAPLSKEDITVKAGAIFVECGHCGATYQFEEEPKW
jgi:Zn finger protein HypA/HybF involved in hydrogenase expression